MKRRIRTYMQQVEGLTVLSIEVWDVIRGVAVSWFVIGTYRNKPFEALFITGNCDEFPSLELIEQRIKESQ